MTPKPALYTFANTDDLADHLRRYIGHHQDEAIRHRNVFRIAVSGGCIPAILRKALLAPSKNQDVIRFPSWEIFFADERLVPLTHEQSNYKLLKDEFLDKIPKTQTPKVHTIDERYLEADDTKVAPAYQEDIQRSFNEASDDVTLPRFDLVLLGCGPDGHTCSLFPGHDLLKEEDRWVATETKSPKPPPRRISLTIPVVGTASAIGFIAPAEETEGGLKDVLGRLKESQLPAAIVSRIGQGRVSFFTDAEAMEGVDVDF